MSTVLITKWFLLGPIRSVSVYMFILNIVYCMMPSKGRWGRDGVRRNEFIGICAVFASNLFGCLLFPFQCLHIVNKNSLNSLDIITFILDYYQQVYLNCN